MIEFDNLPERLIGKYEGDPAGPVVVMIGGIHGNEPAGVQALQAVFRDLAAHQPQFQGTFWGLMGNRTGLALCRRFIDQDMNRLWNPAHIQFVKQADASDLNTEEREQKDLLRYIENAFQEPNRRKILIDLHTTSGVQGLFSISSRDPENVKIAEAVPAPIVFGLDDSLTTTTNSYIEHTGIEGIAFESGQHTDPSSVVNHAAAIWLFLEKLGCMDVADIPNVDRLRKQLEDACEELPRYTEVVYRHDIEPEDEYFSEPGYINFQSIQKGSHIGNDKEGKVLAPDGGLILMPLYQPQGEDGFFVIKEIEGPKLRILESATSESL